MRCGGDEEPSVPNCVSKNWHRAIHLTWGVFTGGSSCLIVYQIKDAKIIPGEFGWEATGIIWRGFVHVMAFISALFILFSPLAFW